jgi:YD repeat-containing protein
MTTQKQLKRRVRERMSKTGERYTAARRQVVASRDRLDTAHEQLASAKELASDERLVAATGRDWDAWLTILDRWGAGDQKHGAIAAHLVSEHGVPGWWAQALTVGYERARGLRAKHQQSDGFTVYVSKTFPVPLDVLFDAFTDARTRRRWLTDGDMTKRNAQSGKVARFAWDGDGTRVEVTFEEKGAAKSTAHVAHSRLPDAEAGQAAKAAWKGRLTALAARLDADR